MLKELADEVSPHATVGVLQDYASLPQRPYRNQKEKPRFTLGLTSIDRWYAHPYTYVLRVTNELPRGAAYTNTRPYNNRGWYAPAPSRRARPARAHARRRARRCAPDRRHARCAQVLV